MKSNRNNALTIQAYFYIFQPFLNNDSKPKHELITEQMVWKTFICLAQTRGIDIKTIMDRTGIKDQKTLKRYLDVSIDTKLDNLNKIFGDLMPKNEPEPNPNSEKINAIKDALLKKGLSAEDIDNLFKQLED